MTPPVVTATFTSDDELVVATFRTAHRLPIFLAWVAAVVLVVAGLLGPRHLLAVGAVLGLGAEVLPKLALRGRLVGERPLHWAFREEHVEVTDGSTGATATHPWTSFAEARTARGLWLLRLDGRWEAVPCTALDGAAQHALQDLLGRQGLLGRR